MNFYLPTTISSSPRTAASQGAVSDGISSKFSESDVLSFGVINIPNSTATFFHSYTAFLNHLEQNRIALSDPQHKVSSALSTQLLSLEAFGLAYEMWEKNKHWQLSQRCKEWLNTHGLRQQIITGDGNCLWRTISFHLTGNENGMAHMYLRTEILNRMQHMNFFREKYTDTCLLKCNTDGDQHFYDAYLQGLKRPRVFCTELELEAAAMICGFNAHVFTDRGDNTEFAFLHLPEQPQKNVPDFYFLFKNNCHWDALLKSDGRTPSEKFGIQPQNIELLSREEKEIYWTRRGYWRNNCLGNDLRPWSALQLKPSKYGLGVFTKVNLQSGIILTGYGGYIMQLSDEDRKRRAADKGKNSHSIALESGRACTIQDGKQLADIGEQSINDESILVSVFWDSEHTIDDFGMRSERHHAD